MKEDWGKSANDEPWKHGEGELWAIGGEIEERRRKDYARQVEVVAELWSWTPGAKEDRRAMVTDLMRRWKLTRGQGRELLRHAELFRSNGVRQAARAGVLSPLHLNVIDKTLAEAPEGDREQVEAALLENAVEFDGARLKTIGLRILQLLDQDGKAPDDRELAQPRRELYVETRRDGSVVLRGRIDAEAAAELEALLSPLAKPKSARDPRTLAERQGDALVEIIGMAAASPDLPVEGGERPHLALTMSMTEFQQRKASARIEGGGVLNVHSVRRIACDSKVMRVVLGARSQVLDVGRARRTIPNPIRRALVLRDQGCAFPGCGRRPRQCHGHHVVHWADGGNTGLDNLVLLCGEHHRVIHHGNWDVRIEDNMPVFTDRLKVSCARPRPRAGNAA